MYCSDRSSEYLRQEWLSGGPSHLKQLFLHGAESLEERQSKVLDLFAPSQLAGLAALNLPNGWSHIHIPGIVEPLQHTWSYQFMGVANTMLV